MRLECVADDAALDRLHELLASFWPRHADVAGEQRTRLETALAEVVANVVRHGAHATGRRPALTVVLEADAGRVIAVVTDDGDPVGPGPADGLPDDLAEGGRGLWIARSATDAFSYTRTDGPANRWELVVAAR